MRRFRSLTVLALGALTVALLPTVPAAAAAPPVVTVPNGSWNVSATVQTAAGVAGISAKIFDDETGTQIGATTAFTLTSGTATNGTWESERLVLPEYDTHDVEVTVTDNDGVSTVATASLNYLIMLSIDQVKLSRTTITYTQRTVTVRGRVLATPPDTGVAVPLAGWSRIGISAATGGTAVNVTSRANGTFTGTVTFGDYVDSLILVADFDGTKPEYYWSGTYDYILDISPAPTRLTAVTNRASVRVGQSVIVSGVLTRNLGTGFAPVAGNPVEVAWCVSAGSCTAVGTATTDAGGNYTATLAEASATGWFQVSHTPPGHVNLLGTAAAVSRVVIVR